MNHLTEEQAFALVDGGALPDEASVLRAHVAECSECRTMLDEAQELVCDLGPANAVDAPHDAERDAHVARVMQRVAVRGAAPPRLAPRRRRIAPVIAAGLALAAGVALFVGSRSGQNRQDEFTARGAESRASLARDVGVRLFSGKDRPDPLENGAVVAGDSDLAAAYTNLHASPAYLLAFAVDAADAVHWLYPAYTRAEENPASILLPRNEREHFMPTSVVLDAPASGRLRVVAVVTEVPLHVLDIERRDAGALTKEALERAFQASVTELVLDVRSTR